MKKIILIAVVAMATYATLNACVATNEGTIKMMEVKGMGRV